MSTRERSRSRARQGLARAQASLSHNGGEAADASLPNLPSDKGSHLLCSYNVQDGIQAPSARSLSYASGRELMIKELCNS